MATHTSLISASQQWKDRWMLVIVTPYWETHGHTCKHTHINIQREREREDMQHNIHSIRGAAHTNIIWLIIGQDESEFGRERGRVRSSLLDILLYINLMEMDNTQHLHQWLTAGQTTCRPSLLFPGPLEDHCFLIQEAIIKSKEVQDRVTNRPFGALDPWTYALSKNKTH